MNPAPSSLQSVSVERFKKIERAHLSLGDVNLLVGGNNSGKSSIIQALHFAVATLQSIKVSGWRKSTSLAPHELIYTPSPNVYTLGAGGALTQKTESAIRVELLANTGDKCILTVRKGKNRNISVVVEGDQLPDAMASLEHPFTVFSPGLAGVAASESYVSDGVLLRTVARGDSNLVVRNILLRLWAIEEKRVAFVESIRLLFPDIEFTVDFEPRTDEVIQVWVSGDSGVTVPLELTGTGVLQATQILSYIHYFRPHVVVLDEPDSHLHPNNQRMLCSLLHRLAEDYSTQVLLTTHSRHVVDAVEPNCRKLWVRAGSVDEATRDDEIGILLDIGALDVKERLSVPGVKAIVLTEDENPRGLRVLLEANGFDMNATLLLPYFGCTTIKNLRPLLSVVSASPNKKAVVVVHRDLDFLSDEDAAQWEKQVRNLRAEPFLTRGTDVESHFLSAGHLASVSEQLGEEEAVALIEAARSSAYDDCVEKYVNSQVERLRRKRGSAPNVGAIASEAPKRIASDPDRFCHGKTVLRHLRRLHQERYGQNLSVERLSPHLKVPALSKIGRRKFKSGSV